VINKTPCRLRDVLDFFRDTGIGTRGLHDRRAGPDRGDRVGQARRAPRAARRGGRHRQVQGAAPGAERKLAATEQNLCACTTCSGSSSASSRRSNARPRRPRASSGCRSGCVCSRSRSRPRTGAYSRRSRRPRSAGLAAARDELAAAETRLAEREADLERTRIELAERERAVVAGSEVLFSLRSEIKQLESRIEYEDASGRRSPRRAPRARRSWRGCASRSPPRAPRSARPRDELAQLEAQVATESSAVAALEAEVRVAVSALRALEAEREATIRGSWTR
jgi:hypothetical protein